MDSFTLGYIEAMLWSSTDESTESGGYFLDENYGVDDLAPEFLKECIKDCQDFQEANLEDILECKSFSQAGHDFWLTRNHHGAGFWDRGLGEVGDRLTKAAHAYGEVNPYVSEGKIYG